VHPVDRPDLVFAPVDSMVMDAVYWLGVRGYEGVVAQTWVTLCARSRSVLEIGGNIGLFTVLGGVAGAEHYTVVEPVPGNVATLRSNLTLNGLQNIEVHQAAAVPGESREVTLNIPAEGRDNPVGAQMLEGDLARRDSAGEIRVPGLAIRALAEGRDLIKIDAEGIEMALLAEIRPLLLSQRPTLLIEVLPEATGLGQFLSALALDAGYTIYVLPEYGSDDRVRVDAGAFSSAVPAAYRAKDVVLCVGSLPA
jgi:FkbM family methyltransferase